MTPRQFIDFFKTRTGKLVLFGVIFAAALMLLSALRDKSDAAREGKPLQSSRTNPTDQPQVVQTFERPIDLYRPPLPKPDPSAPAPKTNEAPRTVVQPHRPEPPPAPPAPITLFADSTAGVAEPKALGSVYAPFGRLIPCETVITVDSSSIQTPIVGLITEDVYHDGRLVIPAGTEVHGTAQTDHQRERIASGAAWTLVWQTGEELHLRAIALDREFSGDQEGWGITDGSAGLRGRVIKSDELAEVKLFAAILLSGAASALTEKELTLLGSLDSRSLNNAPLKGAQDVLKIYVQRILETIQRDGFYVRIPTGKQFYLYVLQTIDRSDAVMGGSAKPFAGEPPVTRRLEENALSGAPVTPVPTSATSTPKPSFEP